MARRPPPNCHHLPDFLGIFKPLDNEADLIGGSWLKRSG